MTISLVDTSVFCELLPVPGLAAKSASFQKQLEQKVRARERLFLPMATIIETGNHIGQNGDGDQRRKTALRFVKDVNAALAGEAPYSTLAFPEERHLREWLGRFPGWASTGSGLGDLSIVTDWERQCALFPSQRVYIWSKDSHLSAYDRHP